jgi:AraC-like DNA-binding protein
VGSLIRSTNLWGYPELVRELGGDPDVLQARFHLPLRVEHAEDAFVSFEAVVRMLDASATELECPDFGLRLSQWQGLDMLGPIAVIARNSATVADALTAAARYLYVHSPALELAAAPPLVEGTLRFTYFLNELALPRLHQSYELSLANIVRIVRLLGGADARVSRVSFLHAQQGSDTAYADTLGCPVMFGQDWCGFEIRAAMARRPIDAADPETSRLVVKYLEAAFHPPETALSGRVAELARRLLPTGQCSVEVIARQLALHPRTLQRHLADEGVRCLDVIDAERRILAERYLADPRFGLGQVAGLLGYLEQSSFNRSCQRWFATTPRQHRAALQRA